MATSRIAELATIIATHTKQIDAHLAAKGLPSPSFDPESPAGALLDSEVIASRQSILDATDELHALMQGPVGIIAAQPYNSWISLQAIVRFGLASSFPAGKEEATFAELAVTSGLPEVCVRRLLRHAMTFRIFQEPSEGIVRHTGASKMLAERPLFRQWIGMVTNELWPPATKTVDALVKWPGSEEPNHTGFNIAHSTDASMFDEIAKHPDRDQRFADAMTYVSNLPGLEVHHPLNGYDWASLGESTIVDVGGSHGSVSIAIAEKFPLLRFIVQDRPEVAALGRKNLPANLHGRVEFMEHDFFKEQPVKDADIYMLRWILHDWSDQYAVRVLQALIPALKPGAKVMLFEQVIPVPGAIPKSQERAYRSMDFTMWATHNAKERELEDWKELFKLAGVGFEMTRVTEPRGSRLSIIETTWRGST
ncbi:MAG: hypothetical protein LQ341_006507 [Variospora aurantia]|nr:MAG: hypothetical protein LQ341_006507 [Variospora aurantia]